MAATIATYFRNLCLFILSPQCYDEFFIKYNFFHVPCLKAALSKGLGYGIIAGSVMVKVPQILKIWNNKSGQGISVIAVLLDLTGITANVAYSFVLGYPFSAWGEGLFLMLQTAAVAALVMLFGGSPSTAYAFLASYVAILGALLGGFTPLSVLTFLQGMVVPIIIVGKSMQIVANYRNGSTGQLSAVTVMMLLGGSLCRIFTSQQETGDALLVFTYIVAASLNAVTAAQMIFYWNVPASKDAASEQKAAAKKKKKN